MDGTGVYPGGALTDTHFCFQLPHGAAVASRWFFSPFWGTLPLFIGGVPILTAQLCYTLVFDSAILQMVEQCYFPLEKLSTTQTGYFLVLYELLSSFAPTASPKSITYPIFTSYASRPP